MGLLSRLVRRLRSLVGRDSAPETDREYRCAICGTPASDPDGSCSLCGATDIVAADEAAGDGADTGDRDAEGLDPDNVTRAAVSDGDAPEDRLRELTRTRGDVLREHADKWERIDGRGRYRVELPDGEVRYVGSKDEVRAELGRAYE